MMDVKTRKIIYELIAFIGLIGAFILAGIGYPWGAWCFFWFCWFLAYELFKNDVRKNPYDWPIKK